MWKSGVWQLLEGCGGVLGEEKGSLGHLLSYSTEETTTWRRKTSHICDKDSSSLWRSDFRRRVKGPLTKKQKTRLLRYDGKYLSYGCTVTDESHQQLLRAACTLTTQSWRSIWELVPEALPWLPSPACPLFPHSYPHCLLTPHPSPPPTSIWMPQSRCGQSHMFHSSD